MLTLNKFAAIALLPLVFLGSCASRSMDRLGSYMTGAFSSAEQAAADPEFRVIVLHMAPIWPKRSDGRWLYVEQAAEEALDKPYRQRIYRLTENPRDKTLISDVYELPGDPLKFAGAFNHPEMFGALAPADLTPRAGCSIILQEQPDGSFKGSTLGAGCPSTLRGASYATSEAEITAEGLRTWDRGYDSSGKQVWGAVKGPYVFKRVMVK